MYCSTLLHKIQKLKKLRRETTTIATFVVDQEKLPIKPHWSSFYTYCICSLSLCTTWEEESMQIRHWGVFSSIHFWVVKYPSGLPNNNSLFSKQIFSFWTRAQITFFAGWYNSSGWYNLEKAYIWRWSFVFDMCTRQETAKKAGIHFKVNVPNSWETSCRFFCIFVSLLGERVQQNGYGQHWSGYLKQNEEKKVRRLIETWFLNTVQSVT